MLFRSYGYDDYGKAIEKYLLELEDELKKENLSEKLQFEDAKKAAANFSEVAKTLSGKLAQAGAQGISDPERLAKLNRSLLQVERDFLLENGLPGRSWFRHAFYAPGVYTGYAAVVLPGVREAVNGRDWATAAQQLFLVQTVVEKATASLTQALQILSEAATAAGE